MILPAAVSSRQDPTFEGVYSDSMGPELLAIHISSFFFPIFKVDLILQIAMINKGGKEDTSDLRDVWCWAV